MLDNILPVNNINRTVKCNFKKAYTTKRFSTNINPCESRESLYTNILDLVKTHMCEDKPIESINDFKVIVAGLNNAEEAISFPANNICIKNTVDFIDYNTTYAFYIKETNIENECSICYHNEARTRRFDCDHSFCNSCTNGWLHSCNTRLIVATCPMCRADLSN